MLRGLGKGLKKDMPKRELRMLTIFNLVDGLEELREQGYFYEEEWVRSGEKKTIWDENEAEHLGLTTEWLDRQKVQPVTAIRMVFEHFITEERRYLYVRREVLEYGEGTVMWISDRADDLDDTVRTDTWIKDMPPIFEMQLREMKLILEQGVFQKLSVEALQEKTKGSLFSLLYQQGLRQFRVGWGKVKEDDHEENSLAWAGEFGQRDVSEEGQNYLYLVMIKREFEEWDSNYGGENKCVWREIMLDIYMARSREPLDYVGPKCEEPIELNAIGALEEIISYLNDFAKIDTILATYENDTVYM